MLSRRGHLTPVSVGQILDAQRRWGSRFGETAVAMGRLSPYAMAEGLAETQCLPFVDLVANPPDPSLSRAGDVAHYLSYRFFPWRRHGENVVVACADPSAETRAAAKRLYGPHTRIAVTSPRDVGWSVQRHFSATLSRDAVFALSRREPQLSARRIMTPVQVRCAVAAALASLIGFALAPEITGLIFVALTSAYYLGTILLRLALFRAGGWGRAAGRMVSADELAALDEAELPVYSIIVPMYREASQASHIVANLGRLDYPAAKLDIKLVLEEDDAETIAAVKAAKPDGRFEIVEVPVSQPRTKPKACNYALAFVRGAFTVIYDAEDRPEPDQLKKAIAAFRTSAPDVACFQARLNVYNAKENWLTRGIMAQTPQEMNL